MVGLGASPVAAAVEGHDTTRADELALVGAAAAPVLGEDADGGVDFLVGEATVNAVAGDDAFVLASKALEKDRISNDDESAGG